MRFLVAYIATAVVFLGLDALWLTQIALGMYRRELGALLLDKPSLPIAGIFYLNVPIGLAALLLAPRVVPESRLATRIVTPTRRPRGAATNSSVACSVPTRSASVRTRVPGTGPRRRSAHSRRSCGPRTSATARSPPAPSATAIRT